MVVSSSFIREWNFNVTVIPNHLNFASFWKDLLAVIKIMLLSWILVTMHNHNRLFGFLCVFA
jgi:hypothetical protein